MDANRHAPKLSLFLLLALVVGFACAPRQRAPTTAYARASASAPEPARDPWGTLLGKKTRALGDVFGRHPRDTPLQLMGAWS